MNDKIEQRARELLAAEYERRNWDSVFVAKVRRGAYTTATDDAALRAIAAALRENTKPEAQAAGELVWQPIATAPKNGAGILALLPESNFPVGVRYVDECWQVAWDGSRLGDYDQPVKWMRIPDEAALSPPASHDAQRPEAWREHSVLLNSIMWRMGEHLGMTGDAEAISIEPNALADRFFAGLPRAAPTQQPAVVGDGLRQKVRKDLISDLKARADCTDEVTGAYMREAAKAIAALTPAATPGEQKEGNDNG